MRIVRYDQTARTAWDYLVTHARNTHFMCQRSYLDYHQQRFEDHSLLVYRKHVPVACIPGCLIDRQFHSHAGLSFAGILCLPGVRTSEVIAIIEQLHQYAVAQGWDGMQMKPIPAIYHRMPAEEEIYAYFQAGYELWRVEPSTTIHLRQRGPCSKGRTSAVKQAAKQKIIFRESMEHLQEFHEVLTDNLQNRYETRPTHSYEELLYLTCHFPREIALHTAYAENQLLAGIVTYETPAVVHTQYIASTANGREKRAVDALLEYLISSRYSHKAYFDFGTSATMQGRLLNENLILSKERCGGSCTVQLYFRKELR